MWSTVSPWAIRGVGFLYAFLAILSMPTLVYWSFAIPSALREPSSKALTLLAFFTMVLTISLAAGLAGWGLLALRPWARVVALGLNERRERERMDREAEAERARQAELRDRINRMRFE